MTRRKIRKGSPQRNVPNEGGVGFFGDFRPIIIIIIIIIIKWIYTRRSKARTVTRRRSLNQTNVISAVANMSSYLENGAF